MMPSLTCYPMSVRGGGLGGQSTDLNRERLEQDVVALVGSVDDLAGLVGWSLGGHLALGAASVSTSVPAVAAFEPSVPEVMSDHGRAPYMRAIGLM